jgi:ribosomal protein L11 methyltransferase
MTDPTQQSWKLTLPCTRDEASAVANDINSFADLESPPVLMTSEPDPVQPDSWQLEAFFEGRPNEHSIALLRALAPSSAGIEVTLEPVPDEDWVTLSQAGLEPIQAGRFFVYTAAHAHDVPDDTIAFQIEAGQAFGTGQHQTTTGCLLMLDKLKRNGLRFDAIADIGTGTGLLAFAAHRLWPLAKVIASDIDPVAIQVSAENAGINGIPVGTRRGMVDLVTAAGMAHRRLRQAAPFDLLIANILAGPLIDLAPVFASAMLPGGTLILAGVLDHQADAVASAYRRHRFRLAERADLGEWPTLRLVMRRG